MGRDAGLISHCLLRLHLLPVPPIGQTHLEASSMGTWEMWSTGSASQDREQDRKGLGQDQGIGMVHVKNSTFA